MDSALDVPDDRNCSTDEKVGGSNPSSGARMAEWHVTSGGTRSNSHESGSGCVVKIKKVLAQMTDENRVRLCGPERGAGERVGTLSALQLARPCACRNTRCSSCMSSGELQEPVEPIRHGCQRLVWR